MTTRSKALLQQSKRSDRLKTFVPSKYFRAGSKLYIIPVLSRCWSI